MSSARAMLQYILLSLLVVSLVMNFYMTIKHSRKETKHSIETNKEKKEEEEKILSHLSISQDSSNITTTTTTTTTNCKTSNESYKECSPIQISFGNFRKGEVFQQETKRKRLPPEGSPIQTLPTFIPMEITKRGEPFVVLNERLISKKVEYYMIILIPTLARLDKQTQQPLDYLNQTLYGYYTQLKSENFSTILEGKKLLFMVQGFMNEKEHLLFNQLSEEYQHVEEFVFFIPPFRFMDPYRDIPGVNYLDSNNPYPGKMARQQTCDIAFLTDLVLKNFNFKYLLYTEDDFVPCPDMLNSVFKVLRDLEWYYSEENLIREEFDKGMCSLKIATGLGGLILTPLSAKLFLKHIKDNIQLEPIDILVNFVLYSAEMTSTFDTCVRRGYTSYVYRKSQLKHIGSISNWVERNDKKKFGNRTLGCSWNLQGGFMWDLARANKFNPSQRKCPKNNQLILPCV